MTGEKGIGKETLARQIFVFYSDQWKCAIARYKGSGKKFFISLAEQLDCETEDAETGKPLTMDALKDEIAMNLTSETLLVFPEAKRLTVGIRYWLEDLMQDGVRVLCTNVVNPNRDIFLEMIEIEIDPPDDRDIRDEMKRESDRLGLSLSNSDLARLQPEAGRSRHLARQAVRRRALGIKGERSQHNQYINVTPLWFAFLAGFAAMKFVGMGTGQKDLQVFGGLAFMLFMTLKQLGQIKGSRKKLGQ